MLSGRETNLGGVDSVNKKQAQIHLGCVGKQFDSSYL